MLDLLISAPSMSRCSRELVSMSAVFGACSVRPGGARADLSIAQSSAMVSKLLLNTPLNPYVYSTA